MKPVNKKNWQDIKSAPKTGERFLVRNNNGFVTIGHYVGDGADKAFFFADSWGGQLDSIPVEWQPIPD